MSITMCCSTARPLLHRIQELRCTCRSAKRLFLLDYDGTLLPQSSISTKPGKEVKTSLSWGPSLHGGPAQSLACCIAVISNPSSLTLDSGGTIYAVNAQVLDILRGLTADPKNEVYIISGRGKKDLGDWFSSVVRLSAQTATGHTVMRSRLMRICGSKVQSSTSCHRQHHATAAAGVFLQRPTST